MAQAVEVCDNADYSFYCALAMRNTNELGTDELMFLSGHSSCCGVRFARERRDLNLAHEQAKLEAKRQADAERASREYKVSMPNPLKRRIRIRK